MNFYIKINLRWSSWSALFSLYGTNNILLLLQKKIRWTNIHTQKCSSQIQLILRQKISKIRKTLNTLWIINKSINFCAHFFLTYRMKIFEITKIISQYYLPNQCRLNYWVIVLDLGKIKNLNWLSQLLYIVFSE